MKTNHLVCVLVVFALLICVGTAKADTLFSYDFENPHITITPTGAIFGQDNWGISGLNPDNWWEAHVKVGTGGNTSQVFGVNPSIPEYGSTGERSNAVRDFATPLTFSNSDTAIEMKFEFYTEQGSEYNEHGDAILAVLWEGVPIHKFCFGAAYKYASSTNPTAWFRDSTGSIHFGDTLVAGHRYEVKAVMDFSVLKLDLSFRDITAEAENFTPDSTLQDMDMYIPLTGGVCKSTGIMPYLVTHDNEYSSRTYIDNISIVNPVPEPSTIALLVTGLIGLLAYAWRKRK